MGIDNYLRSRISVNYPVTHGSEFDSIEAQKGI